MFKTTIIELSNGGEQRNIDWSKTRHFWDVGYGVMEREDYEEVRDFFFNRRGRAHSFRFRDWTDYQLAEELIATGDGVENEFQITKTYVGTFPYVRNITRPVSTGFVAKVDGIATGVTLNTAGGTITFVSPPANDSLITVTGLFDIPMRFDTDKFELVPDWSEAASTGGLPVIETREFA